MFYIDDWAWNGSPVAMNDTMENSRMPVLQMPNVEKLAREGMKFCNAYGSPQCSPARACLQTGRYANETGVFRNQIALPPTERTIAHCLSDAGYELAYIGKWHLASTKWIDGIDDDFSDKAVPLERRGGWNQCWLGADALEMTSHSNEGHLFDADMKRVEFKGFRVDCVTDFALDYLNNRKGDKSH